MSEREFTRSLVIRPNVLHHVVVNPNGTISQAVVGDQRPVINSFEDPYVASRLCFEWGRVRAWVGFFQKWCDRLSASNAGVFDYYAVPPVGLTISQCRDIQTEASGVFDALVKLHPGTMEEKFIAMGQPPLLAFFCGITRVDLSDIAYTMEIQYERTGRRPPPDPYAPTGNAKAVIEPATGQQWASATELADQLGVHRVTVYNHLRGGPVQKTISGRVFKYVDAVKRPRPGDITALSEIEREKLREQARAAGMQPLF